MNKLLPTYLFPLKEENINAQRDGLRRLKMLFSHRNYVGESSIALACVYENLNCLKVWLSKFDCKSELKVFSAEQYCNQMLDFVRSKNRDGRTPLHLAAAHGFKLQIVKCLVKFYSDALLSVYAADSKIYRDKLLAFLNGADNQGNTPLCLASKNWNSVICDYLISKHLSILLPLEAENLHLFRVELQKLFYNTNFNGDTPFSLACAEGRQDRIELWIRRYVNCISYLKTTEDENKAQVLKRYLETRNKDGMTPLMLANSDGKNWIVEFCNKLQ
jgi:ankyrin repeat protein